MVYGFGDWVVYDPGYTRQVGRVTDCGDETAHVCYSLGCTAASTPLEHLRPATADEVASADNGIGFHRFDRYCPSRVDECCFMCRAEAVS